MTTLITPTATFDDVQIIETTEAVMGGLTGVDNTPHKQLANRTAYLKAQVDAIKALTTTVNGVAITLGSSGTVKASTTNALTIGAGLSGTSFDGSAAKTIAISAPANTDAGSYYLAFALSQGTAVSLGTSNAVTYNPSTSTLTVTKLAAQIAGTSGTFSSTLAVTGISTFTGQTIHNGGLTSTTGAFSSTLSASGAVTFTSTLAVTGAATAASFNGITGLGSAAPATDGTAAVGTSTLVSRQDHVHGSDPTKASLAGATFTGAVSFSAGATITGTCTATTFSGSGANLTSLPAANLSGTIPSAVLGNSNIYIGTTAVALNRGSATLDLAGLGVVTGTSFNSITGLASASPAAIAAAAAVGTGTTAARADHVHALTAATVNALYAGSLATSGYQKLPGGLIIQWGTTGSLANGAAISVTFPTAFPSACLCHVLQSQSNGTTGNYAQGGGTATSTGISASSTNNVASVFKWIAIGY